MKFSIALPVDRHDRPDEFVTAAAIADFVTTAERCGVHAVFVTDHPAPDVRWLDAGGHHTLEPTVALTAAATATTELLLHTNIYVLPYRNPFLAARALGSLDRLSGGRLIVGVAAGYMRAEFAALGVPFDERNARLDESLGLIRRLWAGEEVAGEGTSWSARGVRQLPRPARDGGPPLWVGGNSVAAIRRAALHGDGWSPFPTHGALSRTARTAEIASPDALAERIGRFRDECAAAGRTDIPDICFGSFVAPRYHRGEAGSEEFLDELRTLGALGVTWVADSVPGGSLAEVLEGVERYAEEIVRPIADR